MNLDTAVVVGNGESRKSVDLNSLNGTLIGCNALHRDITVPFLVCCDRRMVREALANPANKDTTIYTRSDWYLEFPGTKPIPNLPYQGMLRADKVWHWSSGPVAVFLACEMGFKNVVLVGFDLQSNNGKVNNVYKGTSNYAGAESPAVDPSYWDYQISKLIDVYRYTNFTVMNHKDWELPFSWRKNNVTKVDL